MAVSSGTTDIFVGLARHDSNALEGLFKARLDNLEASGLDPKTYALANIAALIAADAARRPTCFRSGSPSMPASPPKRSSACWWRSIPPSAMCGSCRQLRKSPSLSASSSTRTRAEEVLDAIHA